MGGYIVGLTAMALLCGIVTSLAEKDTAAGKVINLMCSVCMLLCILRPVLQLRPHDFRDLFGDLSSQGQEAVQQLIGNAGFAGAAGAGDADHRGGLLGRGPLLAQHGFMALPEISAPRN